MGASMGAPNVYTEAIVICRSCHQPRPLGTGRQGGGGQAMLCPPSRPVFAPAQCQAPLDSSGPAQGPSLRLFSNS